MKRQPRNPALHQFLSGLPGGVRITKAGQAMRYRRTDKPDGTYEVELLDGQKGEEYLVCCPLCGDKRFRCSVNHMFGEDIEGLPVRHLVFCYNEECTGLYKWFTERYEDFLSGYGGETGTPAPEAGHKLNPEQAAEVSQRNHSKLVGAMAITSLPADHPAILYLRQRGFDPAQLYQQYQVKFYEGSLSARMSGAKRRIIVPITCYGKQVGWQARAVVGYTTLTMDRPHKAWPYAEPKYFTAPGMIKTGLLYNMDAAREHNVVVLVEGVTDVWKVGPWSVALFGKALSDLQVETICKLYGPQKAWIVMLGDAGGDDVQKAWYKNYMQLSARYPYAAQIRLGMLKEKDPGDYDSATLGEIVKQVLHGPPLSYV